MRLSWNEIRVRAAAFAKEWKAAHYEKGDTQSFYNDFFQIFGVKRRSVARYEQQVKKLNDKTGYIDLFWPGVLLVEHKSLGRDLASAFEQAGEYFDAIPEDDRPQYILVSDFNTLELHDLDSRQVAKFGLADLPKHVEKFGFIVGVRQRTFSEQDPVNIKAAERVGALHDALEEAGYTGHDLERFLVRLVFCMFADDTGIFRPRDIFLEFLETRTREDGSDLGAWVSKLFEVLDTEESARSKNLDEDLAQFDYVNGGLFHGATRIPDFTSAMRTALIDASKVDWTPISPAIFGSLFQSVMNAAERRQIGAHYTTEKNILKVIGPLFLDGLRADFERARSLKSGKVARLTELHDKLASLRFLDPACGCGNFLVIAYRELRSLELDLLKALHEGSQQLVLDVASLSRLDVDQFAGIEIDEFASRIAETAMWMMDHLMNVRLALAFGKHYARIPLRKSANIRHADALELDWTKVISPDDCSYILGNPPFVGHQWRTKEQQTGMHAVWGDKGQVNRLDYVTCWFRKAVLFMRHNKAIKTAFVATNSISQGEQASILWAWLYRQDVHVLFAHRTFEWSSDARGKAAVHCVIIGFSLQEPDGCVLFDYAQIRGEPVAVPVTTINAYLVNGPHILIPARAKAPPGLPTLHKGSQPTDGARLKSAEGGYETSSNLILDGKERDAVLAREPKLKKWLRPYVGGDELISGEWRYCLWLKDASPAELQASPELTARLKRVREGRQKSPTRSVADYAKFPWLFTQDRQPVTGYIAIPEVSSSGREYIPMAMLSPDVIASNKLQIVPKGDLALFALLTSAMHMAWMRTVSGRLKNDYSYSPTVYNSFPWPAISPTQRDALIASANRILAARATFGDMSLEILYDHATMPVPLRKAHDANDRLVDSLYAKAKFNTERARIEHLFRLYATQAGAGIPMASLEHDV